MDMTETMSGARREVPFWKVALEPYEGARMGRSMLGLATSVLPYLLLSVAMYLTLGVSYWLTLALAVPTAGFAVRTFIVFHDCTHGSYMPTRKGNSRLGKAVGLLVFMCFDPWKLDHTIHHGTAGDLDRRGTGDVALLTVNEYHAKDWKGRLGYRLFRNPLVMFGLGPILSMIIRPRMTKKGMSAKMKRGVWLTNVALALWIGGLCWLIGWEAYLAIQAPTILLAGAAGVWLFYVQHQYEDAFWEQGENWSFLDAALKGSSYLKLPRVLQFFSGNIGLHHVHHLSIRIPNYNLQAAHDNNAFFHDVPVLTLGEAMKATRLKLWDERNGRLVTFAEGRRVAAASRLHVASAKAG